MAINFEENKKVLNNFPAVICALTEDGNSAGDVTGSQKWLFQSNCYFVIVLVYMQAERQAVNSTVQGSAADLVKTAMIRIDRELAEKFPETVTTHRHLRKDSGNNQYASTVTSVKASTSKIALNIREAD